MKDSSTDVTTVERRRHERRQPGRHIMVRCTEGVMSVFGWGKAYEVPALLDLSSGGARLVMREAPQIGSVLRLDLRTEEGESFEAIGDVRWSRAGSSGAGEFHCGVEFFKTTARQRQEISDLCRRIPLGPEEALSSSRTSIPA